MNEDTTMPDNILAKCGITPAFVRESGKKRRIHNGSMHYYSGEYSLIAVPCQFAMYQSPKGKLILEFHGNGALLDGETVCTEKHPTAKITEAVLVSTALPIRLCISKMFPQFKAVLPFKLTANETFQFAGPTHGGK